MKKMLVALVAVAGFALVYLMKDEAPAPGAAQSRPVTAAGIAEAGRSAPGVIYENHGHFESFQAASIEAVPEEAHEERVGLGDTADLKFNVRDRAGTPRTGVHLKARAYRGNDPPIELAVNEKGKGKYEVPFTPPGPGQFNVVLSDGEGTPI